jgi:hypothetical protein
MTEPRRRMYTALARRFTMSSNLYSLFHMTLHSFSGPVTLIGVVVFRQDAPYG